MWEKRRANAVWADLLELTGRPDLVEAAVKVRGCGAYGQHDTHKEGAGGCKAPERVRPNFCSRYKWCLICGERAGAWRAKSVIETLERLARALLAQYGLSMTLVDVEFTIPAEARAELSWSDHGRLVGAAFGAVRDVYAEAWRRALLRQGVPLEEADEVVSLGMDLAAVAWVHQASSSRPWEKHPHVHMLVPCVVFPSHEGESPSGLAHYFARSPTDEEAWLSSPALSDLREQAERALVDEFGDVMAGARNVHVSFVPFFDSEGDVSPRAKHKVRYGSRCMLRDVLKLVRELDHDEGRLLLSVEEKRGGKRREVIESMDAGAFAVGVLENLDAPKGYQRTRWLGALSNRRRGRTGELLGIDLRAIAPEDPPEDVDLPLDEDEAPACALCAGRMRHVGAVHIESFLVEHDPARVFIVGLSHPDDFDLDKRAQRLAREHEHATRRERERNRRAQHLTGVGLA